MVIGQVLGQHGQVGRRGDLQRIGQARRIVEIGFLHADLARLLGHHLGEMGFGAADRLSDGHRNVIGAADHNGADGGIDGNGLAGTKPQLGRLLDRGVIADRQRRLHGDLAGLQRVEQQIERHHLGQRGGMTLGGFVPGVQDPPRRTVHHQGGILGRVGGAGGHAHQATVQTAQVWNRHGDMVAVLGGKSRRPGQDQGPDQ